MKEGISVKDIRIDILEKEIICIIRRNRNVDFLTWALLLMLNKERLMR